VSCWAVLFFVGCGSFLSAALKPCICSGRPALKGANLVENLHPGLLSTTLRTLRLRVYMQTGCPSRLLSFYSALSLGSEVKRKQFVHGIKAFCPVCHTTFAMLYYAALNTSLRAHALVPRVPPLVNGGS
jgi:hypothetical protein